MLLAQIPRRRRHDGPLRDDDLPTCLNGRPDVLFTDEIDRRLVGFGVRRGIDGPSGRRSGPRSDPGLAPVEPDRL